MDIYILLLILFVVLATLSKLSFMKWWETLIWSGLMALFILIVAPWAAESTKPGFEALLNSSSTRGNVAALVTLEAALCCSYVFVAFTSDSDAFISRGKRAKRWLKVLLYHYPTLMIFPILYYLLAQLFFSFPGVAFSKLSSSLALAVFLLIPLSSFLYDRLIRDREFKLEIQLLLSLCVAILGLVSTASTQVVYSAPINDEAAIGAPTILLRVGMLLFALACMAVGALFYRLKNNKRHN